MRLTSLASLALFIRKKNLTLSLLLLIPSNKMEKTFLKFFFFSQGSLHQSTYSSLVNLAQFFWRKFAKWQGFFFKLGEN